MYYDKLTRAGVQLDEPRWDGPPVPRWNATHDETITLPNRKRMKAAGEHVRVWKT